MADVKISALPAATTPLTGGEVLPIVQSGTTTKVAVSNLTAGLAGTASININGTVGATTPTTGAFTTLSATGIITATTAGISVPTSAAGTVYSGTWTPTITAITNVSASTAYAAQFTRVGNVVTGSAKFEIDPTTALTNTEFELSLPVASNFASNHQAAGSGALAAAGTAIFILASVANDTLNCSYTPTSAANNSISISFSYLIV